MSPGVLFGLFRSKEHVRRHSLFAILRWVDAKNPKQPLLGRSARANEDVVRLSSQPNVSFQASEVSGVDEHFSGKIPVVRHFIHSLLGTNGPLPLVLTEQALDTVRETSRRDFLDMFHHRMNCLLYRAWADAEPVVGLDRSRSTQPGFPHRVAAIGGYLNAWETPKEDALSVHFKLHHVGQFSRLVRTASGLKQVLQALLDVPCAVVENVRYMLPLDDEDTVSFGKKECKLGHQFTLGNRVPDVQFGFRVEFGPLTQEQYDLFDVRKTAMIAQIHALIRNWLGLSYHWEIKLYMKANAAPAFRLGRGLLLGFNTWIQSSPQANQILNGASYSSSHLSEQ